MWKDSETNLDLLDFDYLINISKTIILDDKLSPSSVGIYGDWGSGKSSLMEMIIKDLENVDGVLCLKFNGWLFEGYEDAKSALIGSILDHIAQNRKLSAKTKKRLKELYNSVDKMKVLSKGAKYGLDLFLTGGMGTIADITINSVLSKVKQEARAISSDDIEKIIKKNFNGKEVRNNIKCFHEDFAELLKETKITKLVVFIDELDRCSPDTILDTLEAIRLFLFTERTSFIIGADERQVKYAVRTRFSEISDNQLDIGTEYLEKMIQYPVKIPQLSPKGVQLYLACLLFQDVLDSSDYDKIMGQIIKTKKDNFLNYELDYELLKNILPDKTKSIKEIVSLSKEISSVLSQGLNGNPRHCKRFLNSLSMRLKMAKYKNIDLDQKILAKIMLLEYFNNSAYSKIGKAQAKENGKVSEIELIEDNKWEDVENLKSLNEDKWFKNWLKIKPKLGDVNLLPYFYFSRESMFDNEIVSTSLSPNAARALKNLMSSSDALRKSALKDYEIINTFESNKILQSLICKAEESTSIDIKLFKSLIEWGKIKKELHGTIITFLNSLPSKKYKNSFFSIIFLFGKDVGRSGEIEELFQRIKTDEPNFVTAIDIELKG